MKRCEKMITAPARRELTRWMQTKGLSERRGLQVVRMSASALRYQPRPDRDQALRERILAWPSVTGTSRYLA